MADLSPIEIEQLQAFLSDLCPNLSLALAEQINRDQVLEVTEVLLTPIQDLMAETDVVMQTMFGLSAPFLGESLLIISDETARVFVQLMEDGDGLKPPETLTDPQLAQISSAMTGIIRGMANALTNATGETVEVNTCSTAAGALSLPPVFALEDNAVVTNISLTIPDVTETRMQLVITPDLARALLVANAGQGPADEILDEDQLSAMLSGLEPEAKAPAVPIAPALAGGAAPPFAHLSEEPMGLPRGLEMLLDIPLDVTVELGRKRMLIKDVLELASGSIVELDRVAGEAVDLLVNGRLVARGEVVVIEDNFGIRVTEIVSPVERVASIGKGR